MGLFTPLAIRIGGIGWLLRFLPQIVWLDKLIQRLTRGRFTLGDLAGLPNIMLTVAGRRSGLPRSTPVICVPRDGAFLIAGSYFGGPKEPQWVGNLLAAGEGQLRYKGRTMPFRARLLVDAERAVAWEQMLRTWPNFAKYEERTHRTIQVFELTPER